jgi:hypothetical protein
MEKKLRKLRPADCHDQVTANQLNEQGIAFNEDSLTVEPAVVVLKIGSCTLRIPQRKFQHFAEWYLQEQEVEEKSIRRQIIDNVIKNSKSF